MTPPPVVLYEIITNLSLFCNYLVKIKTEKRRQKRYAGRFGFRVEQTKKTFPASPGNPGTGDESTHSLTYSLFRRGASLWAPYSTETRAGTETRPYGVRHDITTSGNIN